MKDETRDTENATAKGLVFEEAMRGGRQFPALTRRILIYCFVP